METGTSSGVFETLTPQFRAKVLALDDHILRGASLALRSAKLMSSNPKHENDCEWKKGFETFLAGVGDSEDPKVIVQRMKKVTRSLEKAKEMRWAISNGATKQVEYSTTTVLWICVASLVGRIVQLQASAPCAASTLPVVRRIAASLVKMDTCSFPDPSVDTLSIESITKCLVVRLIALAGDRDREIMAALAEAMSLGIDDFSSAIDQELVSAKSTPSAVVFCAFWLQRQPSSDGLIAMARVLERSRSNPLYYSVYLCYAEAIPKIAAILVEDVIALSGSRIHSIPLKKFILESIGVILQVVDEFPDPLIDYIVCTATREPDANLRALGLKIVRLNVSKLSGSKTQLVLAVAASIVVKDKAKSVGLSALRVLTESLEVNKKHASNATIAYVYDRLWSQLLPFFVAQIALLSDRFPSNWMSEISTICSNERATVDIRVLLSAFGSANTSGKNALIQMYNEFLKSRSSESGFRCLWENAKFIYANISLLSEYESFFHQLLHLASSVDTSPDGAVPSRFKFAFKSALSIIDESWVSNKRAETSVALIACNAVADSGTSDLHWSMMGELISKSQKVIRAILSKKSANAEYSDTESLALFCCLRVMKRALMKTDAKSPAALIISRELSPWILTLMLNETCQRSSTREIVEMCYRFKHSQDIIFTHIAAAQDGAFVNLKSLRTFIMLLGTVARENANFIASKIESELQIKAESGLSEISPASSSDDYMADFKDSVVARQLIRHEKEESICSGLLSAYTPLLDNVMKQGRQRRSKDEVNLLVGAFWTLGEFMKISHTITEGYYDSTLQICSDNDSPMVLKMLVVDIWASLQPVLRPCPMKERGIAKVYALLAELRPSGPDPSSASIVLHVHVLKKICGLILDGQLRKKKHHFACQDPCIMDSLVAEIGQVTIDFMSSPSYSALRAKRRLRY